MSFKVCVCGGAGGIGQPLCMLLAMDERIGTLCIVDLNVAMVPPEGVSADLSHLETAVEVKGYTMDVKKPPIEQLEECLTGCHLVIVPAGMPRKPGMTRDDLFGINADIAYGLVDACAKFCPSAVVALIVNPVNSIVPAMGEIYKARGLDSKKILGITTLDVVRANKFVAEVTGKKPFEINTPVIGGHAGVTILPLLSHTPAASLDQEKIAALDKKIQDAGTVVVQAKGGKGSATLSMAYAGARLAKAVLSGLSGTSASEYAYVASNVTELPYFTSLVTFGRSGVETVHGLPELSAYEKERLQEVNKALQGEIATGTKYAAQGGPKPKEAPKEDPAASVFAKIIEAPPDPILGTTLAFKKDENADKINLGVGAYRTGEGKPYVLPVVLKAEEAILADTKAGKVDKEYAPIDGHAGLKEITQVLVWGKEAAAIKEGRIASTQVLSGTGALRIVAEFIKRQLPASNHIVHMSEPTWGNHPAIFESAGMTVKKYPYWKADTRDLDFAGMMGYLKEAPQGSCVLLHACAHNPTGVDPTEEQWNQIAGVCQERKLIPILDNAYQGYASGSLDKDAFACRLFESKGLELFLCQSFAKNLGMYGERIGMIHAVCKDKETASRVLSQLKMMIRPMYSSPPIHGAQLVMKILGDESMLEQWKSELKAMADRVLDVRAKLRKGIEQNGTPGTWNHVTDQIGMFSFTGLSPQACERLIDKHHIYLLKSGRISLAGLNDNNLGHMVKSIDDAVRNAGN